MRLLGTTQRRRRNEKHRIPSHALRRTQLHLDPYFQNPHADSPIKTRDGQMAGFQRKIPLALDG
jgi:hypothetical protein